MATRKKPAVPVVRLADGSHLPVAKVVKGKLHCPACRHRRSPKLIEAGYVVNHDLDLEALKQGRWEAQGWDGNSKDCTEGGEYLALECTHCFKAYQLPEVAEITWK